MNQKWIVLSFASLAMTLTACGSRCEKAKEEIIQPVENVVTYLQTNPEGEALAKEGCGGILGNFEGLSDGADTIRDIARSEYSDSYSRCIQYVTSYRLDCSRWYYDNAWYYEIFDNNLINEANADEVVAENDDQNAINVDEIDDTAAAVDCPNCRVTRGGSQGGSSSSRPAPSPSSGGVSRGGSQGGSSSSRPAPSPSSGGVSRGGSSSSSSSSGSVNRPAPSPSRGSVSRPSSGSSSGSTTVTHSGGRPASGNSGGPVVVRPAPGRRPVVRPIPSYPGRPYPYPHRPIPVCRHVAYTYCAAWEHRTVTNDPQYTRAMNLARDLDITVAKTNEMCNLAYDQKYDEAKAKSQELYQFLKDQVQPNGLAVYQNACQ